MSALCTLRQVRIRAHPNARYPVLLKYPGQADPAVGLQPEDYPQAGFFSGTPGEDGWMLVAHPRVPGTLVGLPLGTSDGRSGTWHDAWENELVEIEIRLPQGWVTITDWSELSMVVAQP